MVLSMEILAYLHTFLHPVFLWIGNLFSEITKHSGPLFQWQTLIGSFLGAFLPLLIGFGTYWWKKSAEKREKRKEAIRRTEISLTQTLHHLTTSIEQLDEFIKRIEVIVSKTKEVTDDQTFSLQETNFPPIIDIYFDQEITKLAYKSYYMHNKILIVEYLIRWCNSTIFQFRTDFEKLLKRNELMTEKVAPIIQRDNYVQNLTAFSDMIKTFLDNVKNDNVKSIFQAKTYNLKLLKNHQKTIRKYEKPLLNFFKNQKEKERYSGSSETMDRINNLLEDDVMILMQRSN